MNCRIHRGTNEFGATCIELEADGRRVVLDLDLPLSVDDGQGVRLPPVEGLLAREPDPTLLGVHREPSPIRTISSTQDTSRFCPT